MSTAGLASQSFISNSEAVNRDPTDRDSFRVAQQQLTSAGRVAAAMRSILLLLLRLFFPSLKATVDVEINGGPVHATVRGNLLDNGRIFLGVPFAESPVGHLRFEVLSKFLHDFSARSPQASSRVH